MALVCRPAPPGATFLPPLQDALPLALIPGSDARQLPGLAASPAADAGEGSSGNGSSNVAAAAMAALAKVTDVIEGSTEQVPGDSSSLDADALTQELESAISRRRRVEQQVTEISMLRLAWDATDIKGELSVTSKLELVGNHNVVPLLPVALPDDTYDKGALQLTLQQLLLPCQRLLAAGSFQLQPALAALADCPACLQREGKNLQAAAVAAAAELEKKEPSF